MDHTDLVLQLWRYCVLIEIQLYLKWVPEWVPVLTFHECKVYIIARFHSFSNAVHILLLLPRVLLLLLLLLLLLVVMVLSKGPAKGAARECGPKAEVHPTAQCMTTRASR